MKIELSFYEFQTPPDLPKGEVKSPFGVFRGLVTPATLENPVVSIKNPVSSI
jgi:hypothetical protein